MCVKIQGAAFLCRALISLSVITTSRLVNGKKEICVPIHQHVPPNFYCLKIGESIYLWYTFFTLTGEVFINIRGGGGGGGGGEGDKLHKSVSLPAVFASLDRMTSVDSLFDRVCPPTIAPQLVYQILLYELQLKYEKYF